MLTQSLVEHLRKGSYLLYEQYFSSYFIAAIYSHNSFLFLSFWFETNLFDWERLCSANVTNAFIVCNFRYSGKIIWYNVMLWRLACNRKIVSKQASVSGFHRATVPGRIGGEDDHPRRLRIRRVKFLHSEAEYRHTRGQSGRLVFWKRLKFDIVE